MTRPAAAARRRDEGEDRGGDDDGGRSAHGRHARTHAACPWGRGGAYPGGVPTFFAEIIGPELLIVIAVAVLLFGGSQIPKLARSLGQAQHEFKKGLREGRTDDGDADDDDK